MYSGWDDCANLDGALAEGDGNFLSLNVLIREVHVASFGVREAHTELFDCGVNFLIFAA